jgi:hypothetical protein
MNADADAFSPPSPVVALAGWLVPGLGYWLIGERWRGVVAGVTIVLMFLAGVLIAGVRVIDVPGYRSDGSKAYVSVRGARAWALRANFLGTLMQKPWAIPQSMAGLPALAGGVVSVSVSDRFDRTRARVGEIGTLYTAVAGMLNLVVLIDATHRAVRIRREMVPPM